MINKSHLISRLNAIDWDFAGYQSESPFSAIHWHPARYASQLPATLIGLLSERNGLVLDPFVGSGSTVVEAQRLGRHAIGIDVNPVACLIARAKTLPLSAADVGCVIDEIKKAITSELIGSSFEKRDALVPKTVQSDKWYTAGVLNDLGVLWSLIQSYSDAKRTLAETAFSAILLPVCRETRHWGYVCDNSTPVDNHAGNVLNEFCKSLDRFAAAYKARDNDLKASGQTVENISVNIICRDTRAAINEIAEASVDFLVTSPPYFGVCDYIKAQRLSFEWFGYEVEALRLQEIGARSKRRRLTAYEEYINELIQTFTSAHKCLQRGALCVIVIGQSSTRTPIMEDFKKGLANCGFHLELDLNRRVSSQRRQAPSITGEHLLILSKLD